MSGRSPLPTEAAQSLLWKQRMDEPAGGDRLPKWASSWPFVKGSLFAGVGVGLGFYLHTGTATECEGMWADASCRMQALLMAAAFAVGFVVFAVGVLELWRVKRGPAPDDLVSGWEMVASLSLGVGVLVAALAFTSRGSSGAEEGFPFGLLVPIVASLLAVPAVLAVDAVRQRAWKRCRDDYSASLAEVVDLRRLLRRLLTVIGSYLAISILAVGAYANLEPAPAEATMPSIPASEPVEDERADLGVLVFGTFFTALLAGYYVPAHSAVGRLAERTRETYAAYPKRADKDFDKALARREKVGNLLGIDEQPVERLKQAVLVSAPLLTGLFSVLIGG